MYKGTKVLDVHGHVSVPNAARAFAVSLMASNTYMRSPLSEGGNSGISEEQHHQAAARATSPTWMSVTSTCSLIGPRPYTMLGFMADHSAAVLDAGTRTTAPPSRFAFIPIAFIGAAMLPQNSDAPGPRSLPARTQPLRRRASVSAPSTSARTRRVCASTPGMNEPYWFPV